MHKITGTSRFFFTAKHFYSVQIELLLNTVRIYVIYTTDK